MPDTYRSIIYQPEMIMYTHDGHLIGGPFTLSEASHWRPVPVSRPKIVKSLYDYAVSLDIPVIFGKRVIDYGESDETNQAYAITDEGERMEADIVVAADGIGSKASKAMVSHEVKAISSGWSAYRVTYPTAILHEDPMLAKHYKFLGDEPDYCDAWMSPQGQVIILVSRETTTWLFTHEVRLCRVITLSQTIS